MKRETSIYVQILVCVISFFFLFFVINSNLFLPYKDHEYIDNSIVIEDQSNPQENGKDNDEGGPSIDNGIFILQKNQANDDDENKTDDMELSTASWIIYVVYFLTFPIFLIFVLISFVITKIKWSMYLKKNKAEFLGKGFKSSINRSLIKKSILSIILFSILFITVLFAIVFVFVMIQDFAFYLFVVVVLFALIHRLVFFIKQFLKPDLDPIKFKFIYDFAKNVSGKYGVRKSKLKVDNYGSGPNAYTTTFLGIKHFIVFTPELLDLHEKEVLSKDELLSIVGHEMGHIANRDVVISTITEPLIKYLWVITVGQKRLIGKIFRFLGPICKRSLFLIWVIFVLGGLVVFYYLCFGIFYLFFWMILKITQFIELFYSRQVEYAADLFGSLVVNSPLQMATTLMELARQMSHNEIKEIYTFTEIEDGIENGSIDQNMISPEKVWEYKNSLNVLAIINQHPDIVDALRNNEDKFLLRITNEKYQKEHALRFSKDFKRNFRDFRMNLKGHHPQTFMRIKSLSKILRKLI